MLKPRTLNLEDIVGESIILDIYDTPPGHERLESIALEVCYRRTMHGHMIVFDLTNLDSFNYAARILANLQKHKAQVTTQQRTPYVAQQHNYFLLVGNKCDLVTTSEEEEGVGKKDVGDGDNSLREVSLEAATALAVEYNAGYLEVSAATGLHVKEAFERLATDIRCMVHDDEASHYI